MIGINLFEYSEVDTSSEEFREKVSASIKQYIVENWDKHISIDEYVVKDKFCYDVRVAL